MLIAFTMFTYICPGKYQWIKCTVSVSTLSHIFSHCFFFCPGVRGADESELRKIVSEPHEEHLLMGADYSLLQTVLPKLSRRLCFTASEPPRPVKISQPGECI